MFGFLSNLSVRERLAKHDSKSEDNKGKDGYIWLHEKRSHDKNPETESKENWEKTRSTYHKGLILSPICNEFLITEGQKGKGQ